MKTKKPCIYLDRDGTINKEVDYLTRIEDLDIFNYSAKTIRLFNLAEYYVIIVTNQSGIARNMLTEEQLHNINIELLKRLKSEDAVIDKIYYCPHLYKKHDSTINPKYNIDCDCRKPSTGMIEASLKEFDIDLENSWIIGDSTSDIKMGNNAKIKTILVKTGYSGQDKKHLCEPDYIFNNLFEAGNFILQR